MTHTHIDLFSGIGGFSLAFESEGFKTIAYSEINPDKILVYEHHFPGVPNLGDIKLIQVSDIRSAHGPVDVITGGVPCTPASSLGQMRGALDERWLWPETIRLVGQIRPRFGLFENPPSLIALNRGREWNGILSGFCALGYDCWYDVFPAAAFGAGHLRERVLLVVTDSKGQSKPSPHDGHPNRVIGDKLRLPQPSHSCQENNASNASERGRQEGPGLCEGQPTRERSGRSGDTLGETPTNPNLSGLQGHPGHGTHSHGRSEQRRPVATPDLRGVAFWQRIQTYAGVSDRYDGLSQRLVSAIDTATPLGHIVSHANAAKGYSVEVLRELQFGSYTQAFSKFFGGPDSVQEKEVLQHGLHGSGDGKANQDGKRMAQRVQEIARDKMRELRDGHLASYSPSQRGLHRQSDTKPSDSLRELSSERSLDGTSKEMYLQDLWKAVAYLRPMSKALFETEEAWRSLTDDEKDWACVAACAGRILMGPKPGTKIIQTGLPARLVEAAARCAGDSVVPQVIQPIAKAIKSALTSFSEE